MVVAFAAASQCFNPRPPRKVGATRQDQSVVAWGQLFQSSPTPKGGRYMKGINEKVKLMGVSILAHPERWALPAEAQEYLHDVDVSILAHPERWALRQRYPRAGRCWRVSILAHPERWALPRQFERAGGSSLVSILAHPERWALRVIGPSIAPPYKAFQSSPTPKGGRYHDLPEQGQLLASFQSSPTPKGGRYDCVFIMTLYYISFNPRPPRKVGATSTGHGSLAFQQVSILAHPERWALRGVTIVRAEMYEFQSSPTPKGGRYGIAKICQTFRQLIYPSGEPPFRMA